jgi:flagellar motor protein MotB
MDIYQLLAAGREPGMGFHNSLTLSNIVTAIDEIVRRVFERARDTPPHEGGLGIDELVHLRPYVLRFLADWRLPATEDHGAQTLTTALQRLVDRASWQYADCSHLEKYLGISSRGWRGFEYEVEVTAYEVMEFDDESTQKAYETGKEVFDKLREQVEKQAKKHLPKLSKFKAITKLLPLSYLVGHIRVKLVRVVEGDAGGPQDEPWEAYYGFALGGISMSKSAGSAGQSVKMSGTTIVRAATPPMKEELEGVLQYLEGSLYGGIGLGGDDEDEDVKNPGMVLTKSMLTFYGGKQAPAVDFLFGAKLTDGLGGGEVGAQGLLGWTWLLDGGESRIAIEPKGAKEEEDFQSYWQDHVPSLAVHFPINGARLPVPTEAERARMDEEGKISVKEALDAFAACELPLIAHPAARIEIDGYADAPGRPDKNLELSENRARSIFNYLRNILGEHFAEEPPFPRSGTMGRIKMGGHGEPSKGASEETDAGEVFDPAERRADIKIALGMGSMGTEGSTEWRLRRASK